jgi:hypothetical protein
VKLWCGPAGQLITGHVLDVSRRGFERVLRDYDHQLYVKWNPKKLRGEGCWEIRRRPNTKSVANVVEAGGNTFVCIDYVEYDIVNHVMDCAFLNYDQMRKLKSMDTSVHGYNNWVSDLEHWEKKEQERQAVAAAEARDYAAKQYKTQIKEFKEMVNSGFNPAHIANVWNDV